MRMIALLLALFIVCTAAASEAMRGPGARSGAAASYPTKPIRMIVPQTPGPPGLVSRRPVCGDGANAGIGAAAREFSRYPTKPIRMIVPQTPGGSSDLLARLIATPLSEGLRQQVIVDNRGGASGTIGTDMAAKAPADGYTIALAYTTHT